MSAHKTFITIILLLFSHQVLPAQTSISGFITTLDSIPISHVNLVLCHRGVVTLPHGTDKTVRVLALVTPDKEEEARAAGADYVGLDEYINLAIAVDITKNNLEYFMYLCPTQK